MAYTFGEVMGKVKIFFNYLTKSYEINQQCRKKYFLQDIV
jgi:hypothetical protein